MRKISPNAMLAAAAFLAVACMVMVYSFLSGNKPADKPVVSVVIAARDIAGMTQLTNEMLTVKKIPQEYVQPDAITSLADALGKELRIPTNAGDQITKKRLTVGNKARTLMSSSIPRDKRAITISVNAVSGVGGFIRPASYVDVMSITPASEVRPSMTTLLFQNVLVLATGDTMIKESDSKEAEKVQTVTLALTPREAVRLQLAQQEGTISLILRPDKPSERFVIGAAAVGSRVKDGAKKSDLPPDVGGVRVIRGTTIGK